jgi:perosamine synthetase
VGVEPGDEVLIPSLTFVATANAVHWCGAVPHLVDADRTTLGLDPASLAAHLEKIAELGADGCRNRNTGRPIRAVVPMHVFGHPVDMPALNELSRRWGLTVVEDAAESLGSMIGDRHCGRFGRLAALSFNGNKILTTGGGGAILTDDSALAARCKHLSTTARVRHAWSFLHDEPGFNFRMPNVNAALGVAQLGRLPSALARKRRLTERYQAALAAIGGVSLFREPRGTHSNYWLQAILLDPQVAGRRDEVLAALHAAGIQARPAWTPMHHLPMYADCPQAPLPVTDELAARVINLPASPGLVHD